MSKDDDKDDKDDGGPKKPSFSPLEIFSYVLVGVTTVGQAVASISNQFFKGLSDHKVYHNLWVDRDTKYQELFQYALSLDDLVKGKKLIENDFNTKIDLRLKEAGIPPASDPISWAKRTWKQFRALEQHDQADITIKLGMIVAIAAAALFFLRAPAKRRTKEDSHHHHHAKESRDNDRMDRDDDADQRMGNKTFVTENMKNASAANKGFASSIENARAAESTVERHVS